MSKEELIIGFFEKGYCCDLDEVKDTCLDLLKENEKLKAELQLYQGALKRENEAIHRAIDLEERIDKARELLGNYRHYSTPDEKQNGDNEDLVNNAFDILKEVE